MDACLPIVFVLINCTPSACHIDQVAACLPAVLYSPNVLLHFLFPLENLAGNEFNHYLLKTLEPRAELIENCSQMVLFGGGGHREHAASSTGEACIR